MSLAPEECYRRVVKDPEELKSTGNDDEGVAEVRSLDETVICSSGDPSLRGKDHGQQASKSQAIDKPIDEAGEAGEVPANIQHPVGDGDQQINDALHGMYLIHVNATRPDEASVPVQIQMPLGDAQTSRDEPTPLFHGSSSNITASAVVASALSTTMPLYKFNTTSLLTDPSFGNQYSEEDFDNSTMTGIDWSSLQGLQVNGVQAQDSESMPSDLWFDGISNSFSSIQSPHTDDSSLFFSDLLPNSDAPELYLPDAYPSSELLLPPVILPIGSVNPPPSAPLPGAIVPHATPPPASIPGQGRPPHASDTSTQLPANISLGLMGGKDNDAVPDGRKGGRMSQGNPGNERRSTRKRKADDALIGTKDDGAPEPKKTYAKPTRETAGDEAREATTEETEADKLEKEAEAAQEAAIEAAEAAKAAKAAAKVAKAAREAVEPGPARRSGRVPTLPGHLKGVGYSPPKRRANKKRT